VNRQLLAVAIAALAGCGRAAPASGPVTIRDPVDYLVQLRCPDGALEIAEPACLGAARQLASDPMTVRLRDWPAPTGYVAQDAILGADGPETLWSFAPCGPFAAARGDGGEVYAIDGRTVRISFTQDGGKPYLQGFYGAHCGGTGWVVFKDDAPSGRWASLAAHLSDQPMSSLCLAFSSALTRYRLETVAAPWIIAGAPRAIVRLTVIAEHYDRATLAASSNIERPFFAKGVGRIVWEAWTRDRPASADLAARSPGTAWSTPPAAGWVLSDCRYATNLVADNGATSGDKFGWPPTLSPPLP
jgi:hypothetical protein